VLYATVIGGSSTEYLTSIRADATGNLYIIGSTISANFPATTQFVPTNPIGGFIAKLNPTGTALVYATQLGSRIIPLALDIDSTGAVYLAGQANAFDLPTTLGVLRPAPIANADPSLYVGFVAKVNPSGAKLDLATYYGLDAKAVEALSIRPNGNIMVLANGNIAVLNATLSQQISSTSSGMTQAALNFDGTGNLYVSGVLSATGVLGVRKYSPDGQTLLLDVPLEYLPVANNVHLPFFAATSPLRVAVTSAGRMYISGRPAASNFPTRNASQTCLANIAPPNGSAGVAIADGSFGSTGDAAVPDNALMIVGPDGKTLHSTYLTTLLAQTTVSPTNGEVYAVGTQVLFTSPRTAWAGLVRFNPNTIPADRVSPGCLVHSATFNIVPASPGTIMTVFGSHLGPAAGAVFTLDASGKFPFTLGGASVTVDGKPSAMWYAADTQINFIMPWSTRTDGALVPVCVTFDSATQCLQASTTILSPGAYPGVSGSAVLNQDYTLNTPADGIGKPAKRNESVQVFMTGGGPLERTPVDGTLSNDPVVNRTKATVTAIQSSSGTGCGFLGCFAKDVTSGDVSNVDVQFAGAAPGLVSGALQVNLKIPFDMPYGPNQLFIVYFQPAGTTKLYTANVYVSVGP
ncbi:MAG: hypothetical protein ABI824_09950, partial [Acidobacteriota bacterium]